MTTYAIPDPIRRFAAVASVATAVAVAAPSGAAQTVHGARLAPDAPGVVEAGLRLRHLDGVKRVLMIGAHPDDEDTALLAALARGQGVETAYLSLTRGDGGQNLIGPELGEGLGVIRTGELEAARRVDGGRQFFTRAYDYGFSKSADEAFRHWPRDEVLRDIVWVIRTFRPQVIVSVWTGTRRDGHGQHQASGILATEAFEVAADPSAYPEQAALDAPAWRADKLYHSVRFTNDPAPLAVPTGRLDPLLGRSHFQVAMESRSQHRSQDMGVPQRPGPRTSGLRLVGSHVGALGEGSPLFEGVDTTLTGWVERLGGTELAAAAAPALDRYRAAVSEAAEALDVLHPERAALPLARALLALRDAVGAAPGDSPARAALEERLDQAERAFLAVASIEVDARSDDDLVVPGQTVHTRTLVWNGGGLGVRTRVYPRLRGAHPVGGDARPRSDDEVHAWRDVAPGELAEVEGVWRLDARAPASVPYYLRSPRRGDLYVWPDDPSLWGLPRDPAWAAVDVALEVAVPGLDRPVPVEVSREVAYVGVDKARGEFRRPVLVVPAFSVAVEPGTMAWPVHDGRPREVTVVVRTEDPIPVEASLALEAPEGWTVSPERVALPYEHEGASRSVTFTVTPPAAPAPGRVRLRAVALTGSGRRYDHRIDVIDYPHIPRAVVDAPAEAAVTVLPVRVRPGLRVGYIQGSGDAGAEALRQIGVDVVELGPDAVRAGAYDGFDALVLGIRVYETRPDVVAANAQILAFAERGGTVVVQYNKYEYPRGGFAPYPVSMSRPAPRVTDESAVVRPLDPEAPLLTSPNRITAADFEGWVQERGLYFLSEWDERFTPLLEMADPGEEPVRGALVYAPVGRGLYVYTGLSFFRQFPAGVPGAYRLFANLVSARVEDLR